jgi:hypothetical protein
VAYDLHDPRPKRSTTCPAPYVSNQHIADVIDERISAIRDRLADERDMATS